MNILITSVGRRSYLVDYFKKALNNNGLVIAANSDINTTGMASADIAIQVPRVDSSDYIDALLNICERYNVKMMISLFDIDLPYISEAKARFEEKGVTVVVSDPQVIDIANDKWHTYQFLTSNNIPTPKTYLSLESFNLDQDSNQVDFPVIVKPRWGMGSIGVYRADGYHELEFFYQYTLKQITSSYLSILSESEISQSVIIQQMIKGSEYGVDVFHDLNKRHHITVVKQKIAMRSGETDTAKVLDYPKIESLATRVGGMLGHIGNLDMDVLEDSDTKQIYVLEFNARFGGGYPFTHLGGVNLVQALVDIVQGNSIDLGKPNINLLATKFIEPKPL